MGFLNSFALKRMAKEYLTMFFRQYDFGRPSPSAVSAIEDAASALDSRSEADLRRALDRFKSSVNNDSMRVAFGTMTLARLVMDFPQYEWAIQCMEDWRR